ncbi:MAG: helix-turn-helix domain-containing protein [Lachnospiraceae bacterium]|nr:helix-turn-helix domain-containing protein [Lachnospiraceae bacterium]
MFEREPDLLTRKQCQELFQISKSKILVLIHEGWLPARKIAGRFRIEKSDLVDFVENSKYWDD